MVNKKQYAQSVRIIAGKFRSRRVYFPDIESLRPTQDSVRETLFSWLNFKIPGASCLDVFAGSGVLGFEALSRGAEFVRFIDNNSRVIKALNENASLFDVDNVEIRQADIPLTVPPVDAKKFDIVFLDPPFHRDMLSPAIDWVTSNDLLAPSAWIYFEVDVASRSTIDRFSKYILKEKKTPTKTYGLIQF